MLFCLSVNYTTKGLQRWERTLRPTNRREVHVRHNRGGTGCDGDLRHRSGRGACRCGGRAPSDGIQNVKMQRLFTTDEMMAIRAKRVELQAA